MIAQQAGMEVGELVWSGGDVHVYLNHLDAIDEQLERVPGELPKLTLSHKPSINSYTIEDFLLDGYNPQESIKAPVAV